MNVLNTYSFKYQPNIENNDVLVKEKGVCDCCGKTVSVYTKHMYSSNVNFGETKFCLDCIHSGKAAKKFDGEFVAIYNNKLAPEKIDELIHRTPGYIAWQEDVWLDCCGDFCQYIKRISSEELLKMPDAEDIIKDYLENNRGIWIEEKTIREEMSEYGWCNGHLFYCPICKKHHLYVDCD